MVVVSLETAGVPTSIEGLVRLAREGDDIAQAARQATPQPLVAVEAPSAWGPVTTRLSDGRVLLVGGLTDGNVRPDDGGHFAPAVTTVAVFQ